MVHVWGYSIPYLSQTQMSINIWINSRYDKQKSHFAYFNTDYNEIFTRVRIVSMFVKKWYISKSIIYPP